MKKLVFSAILALGLGASHAAQAQVAVIGNLVGIGVRLGVGAIKKSRMTPEQKAAEQQKLAAQQQVAAQQQAAREQAAGPATAGPATPTELHAQRTPADKLPKKGSEQILALEAQLDRCHAAMLADANAVVCSPEQRAAIQQAAIGVARAQPNWNLQPYQQEMAYYQAEDARRQQAPAAPAK